MMVAIFHPRYLSQYLQRWSKLNVSVVVLDIYIGKDGDCELGMAPALKEISPQRICVEPKSVCEKRGQMLTWEGVGQRKETSS